MDYKQENIDMRKNRECDMNYREKIAEMLEKVKTEDTLKRVYKLLEYLYLREE